MNVLRPIITRPVRKRTIKNAYVGMRFKTATKRKAAGMFQDDAVRTYEVIAVNPTIVVCKTIETGFIESFDIGDLVLFGIEPSWDDSYGLDPRFGNESRLGHHKYHGAYDNDYTY